METKSSIFASTHNGARRPYPLPEVVQRTPNSWYTEAPALTCAYLREHGAQDVERRYRHELARLTVGDGTLLVAHMGGALVSAGENHQQSRAAARSPGAAMTLDQAAIDEFVNTIAGTPGYHYYIRVKVAQWLSSARTIWWNGYGREPVPSSAEHDIYLGVNATTEIPKTNRKGKSVAQCFVRGRLEIIANVAALFAEFDSKDFGSMEAVEQHLARLPLSPSAIVRSGHGYHTYWLLDPVFVINCRGRSGTDQESSVRLGRPRRLRRRRERLSARAARSWHAQP